MDRLLRFSGQVEGNDQQDGLKDSLHMASLVIQEELARVRTVNGHVASIAFTTRGETQPSVGDVRRLRVDVALQAKETAFTAQQQHPADCPVWGMTGRAPLYLHR